MFYSVFHLNVCTENEKHLNVKNLFTKLGFTPLGRISALILNNDFNAKLNSVKLIKIFTIQL